MTDFALHAQLAADTIFVTKLDLCQLLLMNDSSYPWLVLVPQRSGLRDLHDLSPHDASVMSEEYRHVSRTLQRLFNADKMNVAALGNMVPQLHVHVIARFEADPAWPGPVWGVQPMKPYTAKDLQDTLSLLQNAFR